MTRLAARPSAARTVTAGAALVLALSLAACGSQLDPDDVADANGGTGGTAQGGEVVSGDTGGDTTSGDTTTDTSAGGSTTTGGGTTTTGGGTTTTGGGSGSGDGDGGGGGGGDGGGDDSAPDGGGGDVSCDGFKNGPGITDSEITIGNASDISGPVPGLFESSQDAVKAYVAYFNSSSDICGRKLKLVTYDSRTDAGADQQNYAKGCDETFAMVGSMSAFDSGGAATAQSCGLPDVRSAAVTRDRNACSTCFPAQSVNTGEWENAPGEFIKKNYPDAAAHAGLFYLNAGAAAENGPVEAAAMTKQGLHFDVVQGIDVAEFNYAPYAQSLKDKGVKVVFFVGASQQSARLAQAMEQVGYKPDIYLRDPTDYLPELRRDRWLRRGRDRGLPQLRAVRGGEHQRGDAALPELAAAGQPRRRSLLLRRLLVVGRAAVRGEVGRARWQAQPLDAHRRAPQDRRLDRQRHDRTAARRVQADR